MTASCGFLQAKVKVMPQAKKSVVTLWFPGFAVPKSQEGAEQRPLDQILGHRKVASLMSCCLCRSWRIWSTLPTIGAKVLQIKCINNRKMSSMTNTWGVVPLEHLTFHWALLLHRIQEWTLRKYAMKAWSWCLVLQCRDCKKSHHCSSDRLCEL